MVTKQHKKRTPKVTRRTSHLWVGEFDCDEDAGMTGKLVLRSPDRDLPEEAIIFGGHIDVEIPCKIEPTDPTDTGAPPATIALESNEAGDLLEPSPEAFWTVGRKQLGPNTTGKAVIRAGDQQPAVVVAGGTVVEGKFLVTLEYFRP